MIDYLRKKVSGKKNRHQEGEYDLDLSYITPRIIAMSLPGEGVHKVYRNSIDSVAKFLREKHTNKFKVLNLSGYRYNYEKFYNNVSEYIWQDHYPPSIDLLFHACQDIHNWLCEDYQHIIAINCKAGKGRTGTLICCYLIYCGKVNSVEDALKYYRVKRFSKGGGVTQPSQVRYIHYFNEIFKGNIKSPLSVYLDKIELKTLPHIHGNGCKPIFEMKIDDHLIYTNKKSTRDRQNGMSDEWRMKNTHELEVIQTELMLKGDVQCYLSNWGMLKIQKICRFVFNTTFVPDGMELRFGKRELDPDSFKKSKKVDQDFEVILKFSKFCECKASMEFRERCEMCCLNFRKEDWGKWLRVKEYLCERVPVNPSILLFFSPDEDDFEVTLRQAENHEELSSDGSVE